MKWEQTNQKKGSSGLSYRPLTGIYFFHPYHLCLTNVQCSKIAPNERFMQFMSASQQLLTIRCLCGEVFTHVPIFCCSIPQRNDARCQLLRQFLRREITPLSFPPLLLASLLQTHSHNLTLGPCSGRGLLGVVFVYTDEPTGYLFNRSISFVSPSIYSFLHWQTIQILEVQGKWLEGKIVRATTNSIYWLVVNAV